jgi:hypothetical protein
MNQIVYVEASARIGFLEAYKISNIVRNKGRWVYTIDVSQKPPSEPTIMDYNDIKNSKVLWFDEGELIGLHDALLLAKHALELKLTKINQLIEKYFPSGSEVE